MSVTVFNEGYNMLPKSESITISLNYLTLNMNIDFTQNHITYYP